MGVVFIFVFMNSLVFFLVFFVLTWQLCRILFCLYLSYCGCVVWFLAAIWLGELPFAWELFLLFIKEELVCGYLGLFLV